MFPQPTNRLKQQAFFLKLIGQWPIIPRSASPCYKVFAQILNGIFTIPLIIVILNLAEVLYYQQRDATVDMIVFTETIFLFFQSAIGLVLMTYMQSKLYDMKELADYINKNFRFELRNSFHNMDVYRSIKTINRITWTVNLTYFVSKYPIKLFNRR